MALSWHSLTVSLTIHWCHCLLRQTEIAEISISETFKSGHVVLCHSGTIFQGPDLSKICCKIAWFWQDTLLSTSTERQMLSPVIPLCVSEGVAIKKKRKRRKNNNVRHTNKKDWEMSLESQHRKQNKKKQVLIKIFFLIRYRIWQWPQNKEDLSQWTIMFYIKSHFLLNTDWERWGIVAQSHSPQEANVIRRISSKDVLQSHSEAKNPRKQLESSSRVTVVIGPTNPLTHLLDCYQALDSIS